MFCKNCGNQLADNAKFCPGCGTAVSSGTFQSNVSNIKTNSFPNPQPSWRCNKCGEINKGERQVCLGCGEQKSNLSASISENQGTPWYCYQCGEKNYGASQYCSKCNGRRLYEWGTGAKIWFAICIIGGIFGLISMLIFNHQLKEDSIYQIYTVFGGDEIISSWLIAAQVLYVAGYFVLLKAQSRLGYYMILLYAAIFMFYIIDNDLVTLSTLISGLLNPIITGLVLRKYWNGLKRPLDLIK